MKILAIGDPHGKIPNAKKIIRREKPDIIICTGDFAGDDKIRELIFKNWGMPWYSAIGREKAKEMVRNSEKKGRDVVNYLKNLGVPVYFIPGNYDSKDFFKHVKGRNLHYAHLRKFRIGDYYFVFHGGYVDAKIFFNTKVLGETPKESAIRRKRNNVEKKKIIRLFSNVKNKTVFVTHMPAYSFFDRVRNKKSPMDKRHVGIEAYSYIIKKYKPKLYICGHMHENQGVKKVGRTTVVCLGMANKYSFLIELNGKIKFSRRKV